MPYAALVPGLVLELNIALVPEHCLGQRLTALSRHLARRYPALVQLGEPGRRLTLAPHLTLYQVPVPVVSVPEMNARLSAVALARCSEHLVVSGCSYNDGEGSLEIGYGVSDSLVATQERVIGELNPLRGQALLERDPAGNPLDGLRDGASASGGNVAGTGYAEVGDPRSGGAFRPHVTLNWFEPGTAIEVTQEPLLANRLDVSGTFVAIGVFALGPYGTCPQLLTAYELASR